VVETLTDQHVSVRLSRDPESDVRRVSARRVNGDALGRPPE